MSVTTKIEVLERALKRERQARKAAENILESKSAELYSVSQALRQSNSRLKQLLSEKTSELEGVFMNINDPYVVIDLNGEVLNMNSAATELLGYDIAVEPFNLMNTVSHKAVNQVKRNFSELLSTGSYINSRIPVVTKNGERKLLQVNASIIYNEVGKAVAAQGIARDITEETRLREIANLQQKQLDLILENSPLGIILFSSEDDKLIHTNKALVDMLGYSKTEFENVKLEELLEKNEKKNFKTQLKKLYNNEIDHFSLETKYITKDGEAFWGKTSINSVKNEAGLPFQMVATVENINKEKIARDQLRESENRLSTLLKNLHTGILLENQHREIVITNQEFCKMFGIEAPADALTGANCENAAEQSKMMFEDPDKFVADIDKILKDKKPVYADELRLVDGRVFLRDYIPVYNNEEYRGHLWNYQDITLRSRYKENLRRQKEKYSNIINNMKLGFMEVDTEGRIQFVNQNFCEISGYSKEELHDQVAQEVLLFGKDQQEGQKLLSRRQKGISDSYEIQIKNKEGETRYWLLSGAPNFDAQGRNIGSIGIHLDITEQKHLEMQKELLLENLAEQNERLNEYAHIVSHDLKSPLRNISALLSWTIEDFRQKLEEAELTNLRLMEEQVEKMDYLIENILKYSSLDKSDVNQKSIDLNEVVGEMLEMIYIPKHIKIKFRSKLPRIKENPTRIQQLFQNIISNAIEYIDKPEGLIEIDCQKAENEYVFSIKDNGVGIAPENHDKIFTIFKSLGNNKRSTGIGLSIVKKILDLHGGRIWLESTPGEGTTFFFTLKKES